MKKILTFKNRPKILFTHTICGPKEAEGNLAGFVDEKISDDRFGEKSFELAERKMLTRCIKGVIKKGGLNNGEIGAIISGDLLNQIISASFSAREFDSGFLGVYNACSTMSESMLIAAALVDGGYMNNVICATSSHFATAERQYRYPLEQGTTRPAQSQWTVTGAGANLIGEADKGVSVTAAAIGHVIDYGITDANNMGAAMAPAVAHTLLDFFAERKTSPDEYDLILTGDLGALGSRLLKTLLKKKGVEMDNHLDCGELIYNMDEREFQGGSGAGCSAVVFNSYIYKRMLLGDYKKALFIATGALMSTTSAQQGESIPGIAHLIELEADV